MKTLILSLNFYIFLSILFLSSLSFTACSDGDGDNSEEKVVIPDGEDQVLIEDYSEPKKVTFTATAPWRISLNDVTRAANWVTVTPMSGDAGTAAITITVESEYDDENDRQAEIAIQAGNGVPIKVYVTQKGNGVDILPKKLKSMRCYDMYKGDESDDDTYNFIYNDQNNLVEIKIFNNSQGREDPHEIYRKGDQVVFTHYNIHDGGKENNRINEHTYTLVDGKAVTSIWRDDTYENGELTYSFDPDYQQFTYTENRLTTITEGVIKNGDYDDPWSIFKFTWGYGNIQKYIQEFPNEEYRDDQYNLKYDGYQKNNLNLDLWHEVVDGPILYTIGMFDIFGKRNKYLPMENKGGKIEYIRNAEGYLTQIKMKKWGSDMIYDLTYE